MNLDLPFPIVQNVNNPVESINSTPFHVIYFTIPLKALRPAPCTLKEMEDTQYSYQMKSVVSFWSKLVQEMFYVNEVNKLVCDDGVERLNVFMEYLVGVDTDINDFQLIDCTGIRFRIVINDSAMDYMESIKKLQKEIHTETEAKKKRQDKTPDLPYEAYKNIDSMMKWFNMCNTYIGKTVKPSQMIENTTSDTDMTPRNHHPLHPMNVFSWKNSLLPDMHPLQKIESDNFGIPSATYKFVQALFNPMSLLVVTLPRTFRWVNQNLNDFNNTVDSLMNVKYMKRYFSDQFIKRNDLKDLGDVHEIKFKKILHRDIPKEEKIKLLYDFRKSTMKCLQSIWSPSANVSTPIKHMIQWTSGYKTWTTTPNIVIDKEMSYFGNWIANEFLTMERDLKFATTHMTMFRVHVNCLNAYHYKKNLHNNVTLLGKGSSGKSHILNEIERIFIPGTVNKVSHSTAKAHTIDSDNNDHITFYHELPPSSLGSGNDKNQETGDHILKDMLTSCEVKTETMYVDHDNQRRVKMSCTSEVVGVVVGATNERKDKIHEAMLSRMIPITVNEYDRERFGVQQKSTEMFDTELKTRNNLAEENYIVRTRMGQTMDCMMEKAIYTHDLKDVDMTIPNYMFGCMIDYMKKTGIIYSDGDTIRSNKFLKQATRTLTLSYAADKFANDPQSPGYNKEISFANLFYIQPYLICTEEIALFSFSNYIDQIINVDHFQVMELLLLMILKYVERDENDDIILTNGYIVSTIKYTDYSVIYREMLKAQSNGLFDVKISAENIKVAFNQLLTRSFKLVPILEHRKDSGSLYINKIYVDENFTFNQASGRYVSNFDPTNLVQRIFNESYAHEFITPKKVILGTAFDLNFPFLLDTFHMKPNKNRILEIHDQNFDYMEEPTMSVHHIEDNVDTINSFIYVKKDFESYVFSNYIESIGFTQAMIENGTTTMKSLLYDYKHEKLSNTSDLEYPMSIVTSFTSVHGVGTKNKKKFNTCTIEKEFEVFKKSKLNLL